MRRNSKSLTEPSSFGGPVFSAIAVHAVVAVLFFSSWNFSVHKPDEFELPNNLRAEFVQIDPVKPDPVEPTPVQPAPRPVEQPKPEPVVREPEPVVAKPEPVVAKPEPAVEPPPVDTIDISQEAQQPEPVVEQEPEPAVAPEPEPPVEEPTEDLFGDMLAGLAAEEAAITTKIEEINQSQIRSAQIQSEIDNYKQAITVQIEERWSRPSELLLRDLTNIEAVVSVEILPTGELEKATIARPSGDSNYDQSVLRAIERVRRFSVPDDPEVFEAGGFRNLNITFRPEDLMKS